MAGKKNNTAIKNSPKHLLGIQSLSIIEAKEIIEEALAVGLTASSTPQGGLAAY